LQEPVYGPLICEKLSRPPTRVEEFTIDALSEVAASDMVSITLIASWCLLCASSLMSETFARIFAVLI
jgi:hypothetical protein